MRSFPSTIPGLMIVESDPYIDKRGAFARQFCARELGELVGSRLVVQVNQSKTTLVGAVRGLHFQHSPYAEMKLVRCLKGRVWDVAVDLRLGSSTFLHWHGEELTPQNARMMVIPEGFAHGFQVLEPESELLYLHTEFYTPSAEGGLRFDDPQIAITWPHHVTDVSKRDKDHQLLDLEKFQGINI